MDAEINGFDRRIIRLDTVDSTNLYLKKLASHGAADGTVVIARQQTAGRGRLGRSFYSPAEEGLYLSMLLHPNCPPETASALSCYAGVAVCRALKRLGADCGIKWVNDIILGGRKLGGILCEASVKDELCEHVVVGLGLNLYQTDFPSDISGKAVSLSMAGISAERERLSGLIIEELDNMRKDFPGEREVYVSEYRRLCLNLGKAVVYQGGRGVAEDIEADFALLVREERGVLRRLSSGEVSIRGEDGYL